MLPVQSKEQMRDLRRYPPPQEEQGVSEKERELLCDVVYYLAVLLDDAGRGADAQDLRI